MTRTGLCTVVVLGVLMTAGATSAFAGPILYDQNVAPDVIFGSGNANGSWTVHRDWGMEVGLRAKLRHDATGQPQNTFNSNGDGTYSFAAGVAPTQSAPTAEWCFEWSVHTVAYGVGAWVLDELTYELKLDSDPTAGTSFISFDPINQTYADHAIGTLSTANGGGVVAADAAEYAALIGSNEVAQNSWKPHWFIPGFDPTVDGTYDIVLTASTATIGVVTSTQIQVIVGTGDPVPEPMTLTLLGLGLGGLAVVRRRRS